MEICFTSLAPTEQKIKVTEAELKHAQNVVNRYFLHMLPHIDWDMRTLQYQPDKQALKELAEQYGVTPDHKPSIESFYKAILQAE
jgi:hypothetical protein